MAIINTTNPELLISLTKPYTNLKKVISYEDSITYSSEVSFDLSKFFRYSFNNVNYSGWLPLTNANLSFISIQMFSDFWIEYKYVLNEISENQDLIFETIALEVVTYENKIIKKACPIKTDCCEDSSIVSPYCETKLFNPYDVSAAIKTYEPIVKLTSDLFGFDVTYYKTLPNLSTKDIVLNEYSMYDLEQKCSLKVLIPDNTIPSKEFQFNSIEGISLPGELFEIHIVKSEFESVFGKGTIPRQNDYLDFHYLKKVFLVNSVMIADENPFNTANYYKVNLTDYSKKISIVDNLNLSTDLNDSLPSYETKFKGELEDIMNDATKPTQYETLNKESDGGDIIRAFIDPLVTVKEHSIINNSSYQIVSTNFYDFVNFEKLNTPAVTYKYSDGFKETFAISLMINLKASLGIKAVNLEIISISDLSGSYSDDSVSGILIETSSDHLLKQGDIVYMTNSSYYNGYNIVSKVITPTKLVIAKTYKGFNGGFISKLYEKQVVIGDSDFELIVLNGSIVVKLFEKILVYPYSVIPNNWVFIILNYSNLFKQIGLSVYNAEMVKIYSKINLIEPMFFNKNKISVYSGNYNISNIRLFNKNVEDEQHTAILSQNIISDNRLADIIDNALPQIRLRNYVNSR